MKYQNAKDILPKELLCALQQYAQGKLLYIPKPPENHKKWGENTRSRESTAHRNQEIRERYQKGSSMEALSQAYYLSLDSIRKIVYAQK